MKRSSESKKLAQDSICLRRRAVSCLFSLLSYNPHVVKIRLAKNRISYLANTTYDFQLEDNKHKEEEGKRAGEKEIKQRNAWLTDC